MSEHSTATAKSLEISTTPTKRESFTSRKVNSKETITVTHEVHGLQNEYRDKGKEPASVGVIREFSGTLTKELRRHGLTSVRARIIAHLLIVFVDAVWNKNGDLYLSAKQLAKRANCSRSSVNDLFAELTEVGALEVVGNAGGGRVNGRGIAAERWVHMGALIKWLHDILGGLKKALLNVLNSLVQKIGLRTILNRRKSQIKKADEAKSKCPTLDTTKCEYMRNRLSPCQSDGVEAQELQNNHLPDRGNGAAPPPNSEFFDHLAGIISKFTKPSPAMGPKIQHGTAS